MPELGAILSWLRYRRVLKNRKITQEALMKLHSLTVTIHGRQMLTEVCHDEENGLPVEIRRMYWILMQEAPIKEWAQWN
jgi:hypothetical protein